MVNISIILLCQYSKTDMHFFSKKEKEKGNIFKYFGGEKKNISQTCPKENLVKFRLHTGPNYFLLKHTGLLIFLVFC